MKGNYFVACIVLLAFGSALGDEVLEGDYNVTAYCSTVKPGSYLVSLESCSSYYQCGVSGPVLQNCTGDLHFDRTTQTCVTAAESDCTSGTDTPCVGQKDGAFVNNGNICGGWACCKNEEVEYTGYCRVNEVFQNGECIYGECSKNGVISAPASPCAVVPPNVYFGSTSSCSEWQICKASALSSGSCKSPWVFDVSTGACNYLSDTDCSRVTASDETSTTDVNGSDATTVATTAVVETTIEK